MPKEDFEPTQEERQQMLRLQQQELDIREKEIASRNKLILAIAIISSLALICVAAVVLLNLFRSQPASNVNNEDLALVSTRETLIRTMTALANESSMRLVTEASVPQATPIPTEVSLPSQTPQDTAAPTEAILPSQTPQVDTPPNSILEVGEIWHQSGFELRLKDAYIDETWSGPGCGNCGDAGVYLSFSLTNKKPDTISVRYNLEDALSVLDNNNNRVDIGIADGCLGCYEFETKTAVLDSGQSIYLIDFGNYYGPKSAVVLVDTANPAITEIVISVSISGIENARWRFPIPH